MFETHISCGQVIIGPLPKRKEKVIFENIEQHQERLTRYGIRIYNFVSAQMYGIELRGKI
jgi:hypothetical protein